MIWLKREEDDSMQFRSKIYLRLKPIHIKYIFPDIVIKETRKRRYEAAPELLKHPLLAFNNLRLLEMPINYWSYERRLPEPMIEIFACNSPPKIQKQRKKELASIPGESGQK